MAKITLTDLTSLANDTSATTSINGNFQSIEDYINNKVLSRDTGAEINTMLNDLDMNSNDILNLSTLNGVNVSEIISNLTAAQLAAEAAQTAAETAQAAAESAQTNAEAAETGAEATYDSFDDRYLGAKAVEPSLDNDGDPLVVGALYFNTVGSVMYVYNGSSWEAAYLPSSSYASVSVANTWTAAQVGSTQVASVSGNTTLAFNSYQHFILTLTDNLTLDNPSTETVGQTGFLVLKQDGTGSRTLSLGTEYKTAGAAGITLSTAASSIDVVPYIVSADGEILLGDILKAFA